MARNIAVILGHPDSRSFCAAIASAYAQAAELAGNSVRLCRLGELAFDTTLHHGYTSIQELEPDLRDMQASILWASHLVFVYPNWWGSMPSLLKGFFDRTFVPGFAFKYRKNSHFWDKLLVGRSADVFITMDTPSWYNWLIYNRPGHNQIKKAILEFCGVKPVRINAFGPVRDATVVQREKWLSKVTQMAQGIS
jgi:putative NADPH-quinone reductase